MRTKVAMVASPGGHVDQAYEIASRFADRDDRFWITARTPQTEALLAGEDVEWVPQVRSRQLMRVVSSARRAREIMRIRRPRQLVSTGSALTVSYMLAARAAGATVTYVESATRLLGPSLTGRIAERVPGVQLFRQGPWVRRRWTAFGSIFDGYRAEETRTPVGPARSALVTIGSEQFPFTRALEAVRDATENVELHWQTGTTPTSGLGLRGEVRPWWPGDELAACAGKADVVITHAGVGSILTVLRQGRCPVVIPRLHERGEHIDDHQRELATMLESRGLVVVAGPGADVAAAIDQARARRITKTDAGVRDSL